MTRDEKKEVLNKVLMSVKLLVNDPELQPVYGNKGLCQMVESLLTPKCADIAEDCRRLFEDYTYDWARKNNPNWCDLAVIYIVPGQSGGGLNKETYYEARRVYALWDTDTQYGRKRHQLLDDLIEATKETSNVRSEDSKGSNTDE